MDDDKIPIFSIMKLREDTQLHTLKKFTLQKKKIYLFFRLVLLFILFYLIASCHYVEPGEKKYDVVLDNPCKVHVLYPNNGATINGKFYIEGIVTSTYEINKLEISIDNSSWVVLEQNALWRHGPLDTSRLREGIHYIKVRAYDAANNFSIENITFQVKSNLKIKITSPKKNNIAFNNLDLTVKGIVSGNYVPFHDIIIWFDNDMSNSVTCPVVGNKFTANITPNRPSPSSHLLKARVIDNYDQITGQSNNKDDILSINITDDVLGVKVISPINDSVLYGNVRISGAAVAIYGIDKVSARFDNGAWIDLAGTSFWTYDWTTFNHQSGYHFFDVRLKDKENNYKYDTVRYKLDPISVKITSPTYGTLINKNMVTICGTLSSSHPVNRIELNMDNNTTALTPMSSTIWSYNGPFISTPLEGYHILEVVVEDSNGTVARDSVIVRLQNPPNIVVADEGNNRIVVMNDFTGLGWRSYDVNVNASFPLRGLGDVDTDDMGKIYATQHWKASSSGGKIIRIDSITGENLLTYDSHFRTNGIYVDVPNDRLLWNSGKEIASVKLSTFSTNSTVNSFRYLGNQAGDVYVSSYSSSIYFTNMRFNARLQMISAVQANPQYSSFNDDVPGTTIREGGRSDSSGWDAIAQTAAVAVDQNNGNVYVTFMKDRYIVIFDSNITNVIGHYSESGGSHVEGDGLAGIDVDSSGRIYVCDHAFNQIYRYDSIGNGVCTNREVVGTSGNGINGFNKPHDLKVRGL